MGLPSLQSYSVSQPPLPQSPFFLSLPALSGLNQHWSYPASGLTQPLGLPSLQSYSASTLAQPPFLLSLTSYSASLLSQPPFFISPPVFLSLQSSSATVSLSLRPPYRLLETLFSLGLLSESVIICWSKYRVEQPDSSMSHCLSKKSDE